MKVTSNQDGQPIILISDDPPENNCKPSVDTLFRSAAHHFAGKLCGVIMTGMGSDGTLGLRLIKRHPAWVIAQEEASCVVFGMPKEAIAAGVVDVIVPLDHIAEATQVPSGLIRSALVSMIRVWNADPRQSADCQLRRAAEVKHRVLTQATLRGDRGSQSEPVSSSLSHATAERERRRSIRRPMGPAR